MKKLSPQIWIPLIVLVALGLGLGINYFRMTQERDVHAGVVAKKDERIGLLQKKYAEVKVQKDELMVTRSRLEAQRARLTADVADLKKKLEMSAGEQMVQLEKLEKTLAKVRESLATQKEYTRQAWARVNLYRSAMKEYKVQDREQKHEISSLGGKLRATTSILGRAKKHNVELISLAQDLLEKYSTKGVFQSLAEKDVFVQMKKIDLEKFIQDYQDKLEAQKFIDTRGG